MVRSFNLVRNGVRERTLGKIARVAVFARPVPEAGPEAMGGCEAVNRIALGFDAAEKRSQGHVAQDLLTGRRENEGFVRLVLFEQFEQRQCLV